MNPIPHPDFDHALRHEGARLSDLVESLRADRLRSKKGVRAELPPAGLSEGSAERGGSLG